MVKMEKSLTCNSSIVSVFPYLLQTFPEMCGYTCSPMATEIWGAASIGVVWLPYYFSLPWFPGSAVLLALSLPLDVDLLSQLFLEHLGSSEHCPLSAVLAGHQRHLVLRL